MILALAPQNAVVGLGDFTAYVDGELQTFLDNPCAPGLQFINGSCYRSPGSLETTYGTVAIPTAGDSDNLITAAAALGAGATCKTETIDAGPYTYTQNVCRNAGGNEIANADLLAETLYVQRQLQKGGGFGRGATTTGPGPGTGTGTGTGGNNYTGKNAGVGPVIRALPMPDSIRPVVGAVPSVAGGYTNAFVTQTASAIDHLKTALPTGWNWGLIAVGLGAVWLLPKLTGGRG
jgi:hypothetical protein